MEANPELRTLFKSSYRAGLASRYHSLYTAAKLTPGQIEKFEQIMTDAEQDKQDFQSALKAQGFTANDPAAAKLRQQNEEKLQAAQKEVLGKTGYHELQRYNRKQPVMNVAYGVATFVAQTPSPLTLSQYEQLADVLADMSSAYQKGGAADPTTVDWPTALPKAQPLLSPSQYEALQTTSKLMEVMRLVKEFQSQQKPGAK